ncbi:MAG: FUSC family protein [Pseudomonadota bacterium]
MNIKDWLRKRDPDFLNLRKSARALLVVTPLFWVLKVPLDLGQLSTFAAFACFVAMVFANFGGPTKPRAMAYLAMIVFGDIVIVIGSLFSGIPVAGAVAMFLIIFAVSFASLFGGYASSFMAPIALAYSLAVLDPLSASTIDSRVIGWTVGGFAALVASLVLWPIDRRPLLRRSLAEACDGLADALNAIDDRDAAEAGYQRAANAMIDARRKTSEPFRPAGPMARDVGLLHLVQHLEQALDVTRHILDEDQPPHAHGHLVPGCIRVFRRTSAVLLGEADPSAFEEDRSAMEEALLASYRMVDTAAIHQPEMAVDDRGVEYAAPADVRLSFPIIALSHMAVWVEGAAAIALGAGVSVKPTKVIPEIRPITDEAGAMFDRIRRILIKGASPDGVIFRNSVRAAAAMTLAVVVAQIVPVAHGFWITLAAMLVVHSSAASTTSTALKAVVGTAIGFLIAAVIILLFGNSPLALWILLPITIFFASYAPGVIGFLAGQAAFTSVVVVLFTLIDPVGITTAVTRVETVFLGAVSGALMAFILWPHGSKVALAKAVAGIYRAAGDGVRTMMSDASDRRIEMSSEMHEARRRAEEAFEVALSERGQRIDMRAWMRLIRAPNLVHSLVVGFLKPLDPWLAEHCGKAFKATADHRDHVAAMLDAVGDRLDPDRTRQHETSLGQPSENPTTLSLACIDCAKDAGLDKVDNARRLVVLNEWLSYVGQYVRAAEPDLNHVALNSRHGSWLRWSAPKPTSPVAK